MLNKEIIRLTISNIIFYLQQEEYERLASYMECARNYFHSLPKGQQQLTDFEINVSEYLLERMDGSGQILSSKIIDETTAHFGAFPHLDQPIAVKEGRSMDDTSGKKFYQTTIMPHAQWHRMILTIMSILGLSI